jgi:hypothetical protein
LKREPSVRDRSSSRSESDLKSEKSEKDKSDKSEQEEKSEKSVRLELSFFEQLPLLTPFSGTEQA